MPQFNIVLFVSLTKVIYTS